MQMFMNVITGNALYRVAFYAPVMPTLLNQLNAEYQIAYS